MHFYRSLFSSLLFAIAVPAPLSAFTLSSDFSKDPAGGAPADATLFELSEGRIIKVVDADTDPEDPFGTEGNKSLLFEKNEEGMGGIPRAVWQELPALGQGKLTFTAWSMKEAAGPFTAPAFFALLSEGGRIAINAGVGGNSLILMDGTTKVIIRDAWLHNRPNTVEIRFSVQSQTFSIALNGEKMKSEDGKDEFAFQRKISAVSELAFSVADYGNRSTRVFLDKFELTDKSD